MNVRLPSGSLFVRQAVLVAFSDEFGLSDDMPSVWGPRLVH